MDFPPWLLERLSWDWSHVERSRNLLVCKSWCQTLGREYAAHRHVLLEIYRGRRKPGTVSSALLNDERFVAASEIAEKNSGIATVRRRHRQRHLERSDEAKEDRFMRWVSFNLDRFVQSAYVRLKMPRNLNSYLRRLVHQAAAERNLKTETAPLPEHLAQWRNAGWGGGYKELWVLKADALHHCDDCVSDDPGDTFELRLVVPHPFSPWHAPLPGGQIHAIQNEGWRQAYPNYLGPANLLAHVPTEDTWNATWDAPKELCAQERTESFQ